MGISFQYTPGQTPLDENEKRGLKIASISLQKELDEFEQLNIEKALEWIIRTKPKQDRNLSEQFVKDLHRKMFNEVWTWGGQFRKSNKNLGIKWPQIPAELQVLLDDTQYQIVNQIFPPEEVAIRFKHRIVSIHCFPNGNGRHSRLMADIIMEFIFKEPPFTWHRSNIIEANDIRKKYIEALQQADQNNITPLIEFASTGQ